MAYSEPVYFDKPIVKRKVFKTASPTPKVKQKSDSALQALITKSPPSPKKTMTIELATEWFRVTYPACFDGDLKPLKIGFSKEVKRPDQMSSKIFSEFFRMHCFSKQYKELLQVGAKRYGLDGKPAGLVTKKEVPK